MTRFFVPGVAPEQAEARYAQLAGIAGAEGAHPSDRVLSLRFVQDAEEWTATVGERLAGRLGVAVTGRHARRSVPARRVTDPATVQAIFPVGNHYLVLLDSPPVGVVDDSTWDNPFTVSHRDTREVARFDE